MIEVEKKFSSDEVSEKALIEGANFMNECIFKDIYFDDENFNLTTNDIWFRDREGRYELKLPLNEDIEKRISDQYNELETEQEIADHFKWDLSKKSFSEWLSESQYIPFATYTTTRRKYKNGEFVVDIDDTDFGFGIIEIELLVDNENQIPEAVQKILDFAYGHNLKLGYVRGKAIEYIKRNNPKHLEKLIEAGVVK